MQHNKNTALCAVQKQASLQKVTYSQFKNSSKTTKTNGVTQ